MSSNRKRWLRGTVWALGVVILACASVAGGAVWYIRAALPRLEGVVHTELEGTSIRIERDAAGVPTVHAEDRVQAAFALGFLHGQERFFQMDLARRIAAGELAEVFGSPVAEIDKGMRVHGFRERARQIVAGLPAPDRDLLDSYIKGVNAGLAELHNAPVEYLLTGSAPAAWRAEDTILTVFYMYVLLQDSQADQDFNTFLMFDALGPTVGEFLAPLETAWDAPMQGTPLVSHSVPTSKVLDLHGEQLQRHARAMSVEERFRGSNAWAVSGAASGDGRALLANDMHLAFGIPNVFYRAAVHIQGSTRAQLVGVTLPGFPCLIAGSNGAVAWGFSNSGMDTVDLVALDQQKLTADQYRTPDGIAAVSTRRETIHIKGGPAEVVEIRETRFGPIVRHTRAGQAFAQLWAAHLPGAVNLGLCELERAQSVGEVLRQAPRMRLPAQNLVVADRAGDIGWTLAGGLPRRIAGSHRLPLSSADARAGWQGWREEADYPRLSSPGVSRIWTANARVLSSSTYLDYGFYLFGPRAHRIRERLNDLSRATERDMLEVQLDHRAVLMDKWHAVLRDCMTQDPTLGGGRRDEVLDALREWDGHASADSRAYWLIRTFRQKVLQLASEPFVSAVVRRHGEFALESVGDQLEQPLWQLVTRQPMHLLAPWFESWDSLLHEAVDATVREIDSASGALPSWGEHNRLEMRHPMSRFIPFLSVLFDMPAAPLDGDLNMPLAQLAGHGPVMRFAVSPGYEGNAILTMPGGQAGNPLAPYYGAGHTQWLRGEAAPLLPGATRYSLTLLPRRQ